MISWSSTVGFGNTKQNFKCLSWSGEWIFVFYVTLILYVIIYSYTSKYDNNKVVLVHNMSYVIAIYVYLLKSISLLYKANNYIT